MLRCAPLLLTAAALAQGGAPGDTVAGMVRGQTRQPVADATLQFVGDALPDLPALRGLRPPQPVRSTTSDAHGFRLPADGPGTLLATTAAGLGAFVPWVFPGAPIDVALEPMAEIARPDGAALTLHAAWLGADGERRLLPELRGAAIRLPAGSYECWLDGPDGWQWLRLDLRSSQSLTLPAATLPAQTLLRLLDGDVHPDGRPDVVLLDREHPTCALRGTANDGSFTAEWLHLGVGADHLHLPTPGAGGLPFPPSPGELLGERKGLRVVADGKPAAGAALFLVLGQAARTGGRAVAGADGNAAIACLPGMANATEVLVVARGRAVAQLNFAKLVDGSAVELRAADELAVTCVGPDGGPATAVRLEYEPDDAPLAAVAAATDSRGRARIGDTRRPGTLRAVDPRYGNQAVEVLAGKTPVQLRLTAGAEVRGVLKSPDGTAAAAALVTLRDPTGHLRPATRSAVTGKDGSFAFHGLPDDGSFVLFAQLLQGTHTWSAKVAPVRPGGDALAVSLADEDPVLRQNR